MHFLAYGLLFLAFLVSWSREMWLGVRSTRARRSPRAGHLANGGHPLLPESAPWGFLSGWGCILVRTPSLAAE